ncbi:hypothetical protein ACIQTU_11565 [Brevundimonas sp. NPDC090276]|uniref:hypothetical protein n=1 Tax=Brevundimonas sp. NPDC090276 TaxID=3363956 RepID=UPI00383B048F
MNHPDSNDPAAALASIREAQAVVHDKLAQGSWRYDLIYSFIAAVMVGGQAAPLPFNVLASGVGALSLALLMRAWSEKNGITVLGTSPKKARWVAYGVGALFLILMGLALYAGRRDDLVWAPYALTVIAFVGALVFSRLWLRVYRTEAGAKG